MRAGQSATSAGGHQCQRANEVCCQVGGTSTCSCLGEAGENCSSASANKFQVSIGTSFCSQAVTRSALGLGWLLAARGTLSPASPQRAPWVLSTPCDMCNNSCFLKVGFYDLLGALGLPYRPSFTAKVQENMLSPKPSKCRWKLARISVQIPLVLMCCAKRQMPNQPSRPALPQKPPERSVMFLGAVLEVLLS